MDERHEALWAMPESVLYDIFAESANQLGAAYFNGLDRDPRSAEHHQI